MQACLGNLSLYCSIPPYSFFTLSLSFCDPVHCFVSGVAFIHLLITMSGTPSPITGVDGTTTFFLPLTTTFTPNVGDACSTLFVQPGPQETGLALYLLDPAYVTINSSISCQPSQADLWWHQGDHTSRTGSLSLSSTLLGGYSVACPSLYDTNVVSVINSQTTLIGCCPK